MTRHQAKNGISPRARRSARAAPAAFGEFAEKLFQLLVNTLSFVRVVPVLVVLNAVENESSVATGAGGLPTVMVTVAVAEVCS
mgnify:CR=1 FL=1